MELAYKLVEHCQLREITRIAAEDKRITKVLSLSLFPERCDIATYWQSHIIFIFFASLFFYH